MDIPYFSACDVRKNVAYTCRTIFSFSRRSDNYGVNVEKAVMGMVEGGRVSSATGKISGSATGVGAGYVGCIGIGT